MPDDLILKGTENKLKSADRSSAGSRVVALINPVLHCRSTCVELIRSGVNLVGIVEASTKQRGLPIGTLRRLLKKQSIAQTTSQIAARLAYLASNRKSDALVYERLFNQNEIEEALKRWDGPTITCRSYGDPDTRSKIDALQPDILIVHSQDWVTKKVRELSRTGLVIGGHPGITPHYRGSHSSFWALIQQQPEMIGWTAFHVDQGVDCGDVIIQGRLSVEDSDSFMTLNWRGMKEIARAQAEAILQYDASGEIPRNPHRQIPPNSEYGLPGLRQYLTYRRLQKAVR